MIVIDWHKMSTEQLTENVFGLKSSYLNAVARFCVDSTSQYPVLMSRFFKDDYTEVLYIKAQGQPSGAAAWRHPGFSATYAERSRFALSIARRVAETAIRRALIRPRQAGEPVAA